ncbi:MAG TPA: SDR family oxidoreductase [Limnochordia bacterium]|nr:SDR family oxidoreductase [Limnochordia bacterium]
MQQGLTGSRILIVGASSGMGRATALAFAEAGARVAISARRQTALEENATAARAAGAKDVLVCPADATVRGEVERVVAACCEAWGGIDVLVYASGTNTPRRALQVLPPAEWDELLATNLTGAFHCTQAVLPHMLTAGGGLLIYLSSTAALSGDRSGVAYQASKRGMVGLAFGLMEEHRRDGIRASVIYPGLTVTPILEKRPAPTPPEQLAVALQPEDVAQACLFLAELPARAHVPELVLRPARL